MKHSRELRQHWTRLHAWQQAAAAKRSEWQAKARPDQLTPPGGWPVWLVKPGRGWGKTRCGAEDAAWFAVCNPGSRIAVCAPTAADARDTCIEGHSGLLSVLAPECVQTWNRSLGELILVNGSRFKAFSADEPDRFRGPQHHRAWADELAAWKYPEAWDQLMFGLRLGDNPQAVVTTTPRPTPLIRQLARDARNVVVNGSTFDNAANLAPSALAQLRERYEGTRLGRQELFGEILEEVDGALWTMEVIGKPGPAPDLQRVVVGVDPSGGGDEIGIIAAGKGIDGRFYVLEDATCSLSPAGWGRRVAEVYARHRADRIVAERNFGGDMVLSTIRTAEPNARVEMVTASRGKVVRAEPIAALYEQGRVTHSAGLEALETQMLHMTTQGYVGDGSPDRVDALVWALSALALTSGHGYFAAL
jgi:phage terminase large subunit-like protein